MKLAPSSIERLESPIAPASLVLTDLDGDTVTFTASAGALAGLVTKTNARGDLHSVFSVDLSGALFGGTDLTVAVKKGAGGDGLAIVGNIAAGVNNLGTVKIAGDLGDLDAGSGSGTVLAIKSLSVQSFGRFGERGSGNRFSLITGSGGSLTVKGDLIASNFYATGDLASASVGGSVIGGGGALSGSIYAGSVGPELRSPVLNLGSVTIGGSIQGGETAGAGSITASGSGVGIGLLKIKGDVLGNVGTYSGSVTTTGGIGTRLIGGEIIPGVGANSGTVS